MKFDVILTALTITFFQNPVHAKKVDVHAHATVTASGATAADLIAAMDGKNLDTAIMMITPDPLEDVGLSDTGDLEAFFPSATYGSRIKFMYGGAELNYLIHGIGRSTNISDSTRWDATGSSYSVFPNGCGTGIDCTLAYGTGLTMAQTIETAGKTGTYHDLFISRATTAAMSGRYVGFGELAPLHYSQRNGHPYVSYPANHAWMLELSDIAATYNMVIDLHVEITDTTRTELEELLAHNRSTKILLEHVGWSTYGTATASILSAMMSANSNLYLVLKKCHSGGPDACYLNTDGTVKSEWITLLTDAANSSRIMLGSDAKYWNESSSSGSLYTPIEVMNMYFRDKVTLGDRIGDLKRLLDYLTTTNPSVSDAIMGGNATTLFGL